MNILMTYTWDYLWRNRKSSVGIMIALLIATTMLATLTGILYTFYTDELRLIIEEEGHWHAELFDSTPGDKLKYVTGHPNVETVMIKGPWEIAAIEDPRRPYLAMRGLTSNYWEFMPEHQAIIEGRIPQREDELVISKQFFEHHPELKVGDQITLPIGERRVGFQTLEVMEPFHDGEFYHQKTTRTYTIVGKFDITTSSLTPCYLAYGFLDEASIGAEDDLTVYMRFYNPRSTYKDINEIAQSVGYTPDVHGDYMVRVNGALLKKYLIFPPDQRGDVKLWMLSQPLMLVMLAILVTAVFIFIIHNAFALSANARLKQLGMLKSIGATPKQIRRSVIFEGMILSVIPLPIGLVVGRFLSGRLFAYINSLEALQNEFIFSYGLPAALPAVLLALATVWFSTLIPARKVSRLTPIEAIRQGGDGQLKPPKRTPLISRLLGIEGELAQNTLTARRRSYRTATISLTLSFLLFSGFLNIIAVNDARSYVYTSLDESETREVSLYLEDGNLTQREFEAKLRSVKGVENIVFISEAPAGLWVTSEMASKELQAMGGLEAIIATGKYPVYEDHGRFRIRTNLFTLDDESFEKYCKEIGADPSWFYDTATPRTIVVNQTLDAVNSNLRNQVRIPFLQISQGELLEGIENIYPEDVGTFTFTTEVGFITDRMPTMDGQYGSYQLLQVLPRSQYLRLTENFSELRAARAKRVFVSIKVTDPSLIQPVTDEIKGLADVWYGSGDYTLWNTLEKEANMKSGVGLWKLIMTCIAGFLALIGISNVFSTVSSNLRQRRKEFAMLRSVGLDPKGIKKMLTLEAVLFGLLPIALSIPLVGIIILAFLKINMIYLHEFLPFFPLLPICGFALLIVLSVMLAYRWGSKTLYRDGMVEVLKNEIF